VRPLGVALLTMLTLLAGVGEAALPAPPFTLSATPTRVAAGEAVQLAITPRGGEGHWDLYVMWALVPEAAFLTSEGAWSPRPVPFAARVPAAGPPLGLRWVPAPPGEMPLALLVVPTDTDPLARFDWVFQPVLVHVSVRGPADTVALDLRRLVPLIGATLLACALVLLSGNRFLG
jgi:hypothetical protein